MATITQVKKRDSTIAAFDQQKIAEAIFRAARSVGGADRAEAKRLADLVVQKFIQEGKPIPSVEEIQDTVEKVLIETGHAKTAKAYILYRQQHAELRKEKMLVLEKQDIDEVDKAFDLNALRVLKARYLRKREDGHLIETPKQLFTRVATHSAIANLIFDPLLHDREAKQQIKETVEFDHLAANGVYRVGKYALNEWHMEALKRLYDRHNQTGSMKVGWGQLLDLLREGKLNHIAADVDKFYTMMVRRQFMPNTPAIANFGNSLGMGSACFVMDVPDSIEGIMETLKQTAIIFKAGGGMGYNFSKLRPEGDFVASTGGVASGPLTFMKLFDTMTDVIKQGGIRRGANMGILNSNHPDIEKFITAKAGNKTLRNFNISVLIMPDFWQHYEQNTPYPLRNPRTGEVVRTVNPRELFDKIVYQAWESAEPGVIFFDPVNDTNPFYESLGPIVTTNPCGEVLLYPYESCNLGSINVWHFAREDEHGTMAYDWDGLRDAIYHGTEFLDNVVEVNKFPLQEFEDMALATRKIGLGVMGLGDLLYELKLPYNSEEGRAFMERLMQFINYHSKVWSVELAKKRGPVPYFDRSFYPKGRMPFKGFEDRAAWDFDWTKIAEDTKQHGVRNGYTIVIAPTGSISMIAGTSSGIEPVYSLVFEKNVKVGSFFYVDPVFERYLKRAGLHSEQLMEKIIANGGSVQGIAEVPEDMRRVFVTAMDCAPEDHIRALAAFQKWVDSSISKTNNFPANATLEDMRQSYILAYKLGCKDVTVFRDSSIKDQVLVSGGPKKSANTPGVKTASAGAVAPEMTIVQSVTGATHAEVPQAGSDASFRGKPTTCPECSTKLDVKEGCVSCGKCGWGVCS